MPRTKSNVVEPDAGNSVANGNDAGAVVGVGDNGSNKSEHKSADGLIIIDPTELGNDTGSDIGSDGNNTGSPKPRRKRRTTGTRRKKNTPLDINGVEGILISMHTILASVTKTPELLLDKDEANQVSKAIANVSRHYDVQTSEKAMDWTNLFMSLGMVYGTRIFAIRNNRASKKVQQAKSASPVSNKPPSNSNVVDIPGVGKVHVE